MQHADDEMLIRFLHCQLLAQIKFDYSLLYKIWTACPHAHSLIISSL